MKKIIIYSLIIIVIIVGGYFLFFNKDTKNITYKFDEVSQGDLKSYVTSTGTINAVITVEVGTQVSGIISKLYADFNSVVKEGNIIAQIDPTFLQQAVKDAEANLDKVNAQYQESLRSFERIKTLYEKNLESQVTYDAALTTLESSKASLKQAQAQLERANINLAYATIYAPINGVVIDRKVNVGQTVAASFSSPTLFTIANDLSKMQVEATVDESDIGRVVVGQQAEFTVDAYPNETFYGTVSQIRLAPQIIQNVIYYTVVIEVNNKDLKLMPGMTANVRILVAEKNNVLKVPNMALRFQPPPELVDSILVKQKQEEFRNQFASMKQKINQQQTDVQPNKNVSNEPIILNKKMSLNSSNNKNQIGQIIQRTEISRNKFSIYSNYPQYQKSAFVNNNFSNGRVWILNEKTNKLEPIFVRTGLNDGRTSEVITDKLKVGSKIIVGVQDGAGEETNATNPFAPQQQPSLRGGGRR
ncbi:MAG: hypothetical protein STSR0008_17240 [Ignavibacterium sp.]